MSEERALTWSGKWHIINPGHPDAHRYAVARCGSYVYRNDDPQYPPHLTRIKDGTKKSTGLCKSCSRSVGVKTVTVELPDPDLSTAATDDVNGYVEWDYPHGSVAVSDDGTVMWGSWHITDPQKIRAAGAALLAAAVKAEESM